MLAMQVAGAICGSKKNTTHKCTFLLVKTFASEFEVALHVKGYLFSKLYSKLFYFFA